MKTALTDLLGIELPIIMAPMFLVTNTDMMVAAAESGIAGCIPALNFRTIEELEAGIKAIQARTKKPFGVNLIVNKSNIQARKQMYKCIDLGVSFFITSLGSPEEVIRESKSKGIKVFCDVIEKGYAKKVEGLGADGVIAVNSGAGGHLGNIPASVLIPELKRACKIPVISAGGVGTGAGIMSMLALGADGLSIGSPFIATTESGVTQEYKQACVDYGAEDIVTTTKLSGSRCTVINTPYVKKVGTEQNILESVLNKNKQIKKYAKMLTYYKGMKMIEKAAFSATYKTIWCAGSSIEFSKKIEPVKDIVTRFRTEMITAQENLTKKIG
ncbi:MAG TPA: nitronate monooxygenase [Bacteriovoracaceae bacterium]|nr:nitronate monooxygenase [Bacteriovoracaceae bacterium]